MEVHSSQVLNNYLQDWNWNENEMKKWGVYTVL